MADEEAELLSVLEEMSFENPIGQNHDYVDEARASHNNRKRIIDPSRLSENATRVSDRGIVYNTADGKTVDLNDPSELGDDDRFDTDVNSSARFLPRLVFLDSDENISSSSRRLSAEVTEIREERSVSDSVLNPRRDLSNGLTPLSYHPRETYTSGFTNRLSQVSVQSSDSELLMDHNVMDADRIPPVAMLQLKGAHRIHIGDDDWHCHLKNSKLPPDKTARNQLIIVSVLCFLFMVGEAIGGILSNSLALFTDVLHLGSDLVSFLVSLLAMYLARKPATKTMSFGYHRAEVLGALMSVFIIWSVTGVLIYMAVERIINEHYKDVKADEMLITAILGVVFNIVMGIVLHSELCCKRSSTPSFGHNHSHGGGSHHSHNHSNHMENHSNHLRRSPHTHDEVREPLLDNGNDDVVNHVSDIVENYDDDSPPPPKNINVRAAFIHVVGDIIQSIGVLVSSLIIKLKPEDKYRLADPICTFLFSILVLFTTITVLRDTLQIIMEGVPRGYNYYSIKSGLQKIEGVESVHGLNVWCLTLEKNILAVHIAVGANVNHKKVLQEASEFLHRNYNFFHSTIQIEDYTSKTAQCSDCQELHK